MAIITGTNGDDKEPNELEGTEAADRIYGLAGNDALVGFGGDDLLDGGKGADQLFGSGGLDLASYQASDRSVLIDLDGFVFRGGHADGDHLFSIEGVVGSAFGDTMVGSAERNVLRGEGGNDGILGRAGDDTLHGGDGNDHLTAGAGNDEVRGGAGADTASFFYDLGAVVADLASGTATGSFSGADRLFGIENLVGTANGNDQLLGNDGANVLIGGYGADVLAGRGGADRFDYSQTRESGPTTPDRIRDFSRTQGDKIDLADVDANPQVDGNEAFQFVGKGAFTGTGQLRWYQQGGDTIVEANTTDEPGAELRIEIDPLVSLQATDFLL